ncbi:MAG: alkylation response protein AidB-like acyl-CoA dehydrogenase [Gammaproteobacteria bacterium]|jgi:alkylation response protein AidB-like acyl-CoA dehydrogenase
MTESTWLTIGSVKLQQLAAEAKERALEFEEHRSLSTDFTDKLKAGNLFRILVPETAGGLGGSLLHWLEVMTMLSEADASTGWVCAHANLCSALIYACGEPWFGDEFFCDPQACAAWSNLPNVEVKESEEGLVISGSWSFESGCTAATFVGGMVNLPPLTADTLPRRVVVLAPVSQAQSVDTWDPVGLAGTGSHDVHFAGVFVPWYRTLPWPSSIPVAEYPCAVFAPGTWFVSICAAATHLGLARRALDEARAGLEGKFDRHSKLPMLEHPSTQRTLEAAEGLWFACRAGMREALAKIWSSGLRAEPASSQLRINARLAAVTAVHKGAEIVRTAYDVSGASAVRRAGTMQRLMREASCLIHHVSVNSGSYEYTAEYGVESTSCIFESE